MRRWLVWISTLSIVACGSHGATPRAAQQHATPALKAAERDPREAVDSPAASPAASCSPVDESKLEPPACNDAIASVPVPPIIDPSGSLAHFHERLSALARNAGGSASGDVSESARARDRVRIALYGDSNAQADMMTGHLRRVLQGRMGDGGHGFVVLGHPKGFYGHQDVRRGASWKAFTNLQVSNDLTPDGHYGFANIASETSNGGARAWVGTARQGPVGTRAGLFDVFFFRRPGGGSFDILADGKVVRTVSTRADAFEAGFESIALEDGPHEVACVTRGGGRVRLAGIALERDAPGVVVDALGTGALSIGQMTWVRSSTRTPMLRRRGYDLVIIHLGTAQGVLSLHKTWALEVIGDLRAALPDASFLFLTPPDMLSERWRGGSDPRIVTVSRQIGEIATEARAAFWDYRAAMGGDGSMATFLRKKLAWKDAIHLSEEGHVLMGDRLLRALLADNARYRGEHPTAGCVAP